MTMIRKLTFAALLAPALVALSSNAAEPGFYIGGGGGQVRGGDGSQSGRGEGLGGEEERSRCGQGERAAEGSGHGVTSIDSNRLTGSVSVLF
jgi:hypothetical protein